MGRIYCEGIIAASEDGEMLDYFGIPNITPEKLRTSLTEQLGEPIELWINCYGGDVWAAMAMYSELQKYEEETTAFVTGLSASAATILMLGCEKVIASIGSQFMFHNAQTEADGDYHDMYIAADQLKSANDGISAVYAKKTGKPYDEIKNLMERTTWFSAQEALDFGFVDTIETFEKERLVASVFNINNLRNKFHSLKNERAESRGDEDSCQKGDSSLEPTETSSVADEGTTSVEVVEENKEDSTNEIEVERERINIERRRFNG